MLTVPSFAELDSLQSNHEHFNEHLEQLGAQRLCTSKVFNALQAVNDIIKRKRTSLIGKIVEIVLRTNDQASIEEMLWIYHVVLRDLDNYELDAKSRRLLLMKARSFYREHRLYLEAEKALQRCPHSSESDADMSDFQQLYARSIEETCCAAANALLRYIEDWQMPEGLNESPFSSLHRAVHHPLAVPAIVASEKDKPPARNIIGQTV